MITTASGLQYEDTTAGTGATAAAGLGGGHRIAICPSGSIQLSEFFTPNYFESNC